MIYLCTVIAEILRKDFIVERGLAYGYDAV